MKFFIYGVVHIWFSEFQTETKRLNDIRCTGQNQTVQPAEEKVNNKEFSRKLNEKGK